MIRLQLLGALAILVVGAFAFTTESHADEPFICPIVGAGIAVADDANGDNGVSTIHPPAGYSFLPGDGSPGQNQAGMNVNPNAHNTQNS